MVLQVVTEANASLLQLDGQALCRDLNTRACFVHHNLTDHPLLRMPRLLELAKWLPEKDVRINSGAVPVNATPDQIPETGLSVEDSFRTIENSSTRIMLKGIELHPEYQKLLHACIGEIEALGHPSMKGIHSRVGYVFISAPNMTTPYHMDPEINFLLQIRGRKTFFVLSEGDRAILSEQDIEGFYTGHHNSLPFHPETKDRAVPFTMDPGAGVHIPVNNPHWVTTENEVTISFALTMETDQTKRRGTICAFNYYLRRLGMRPKPFGYSPVRDFLKDRTYGLWRGIKSCLPGKKQDSHDY